MRKKLLYISIFAIILMFVLAYLNTNGMNNEQAMAFYASKGAKNFGEYVGGLIFNIILASLFVAVILSIWKAIKKSHKT